MHDQERKDLIKKGIIAFVIILVLYLHYFTFPAFKYHHAVYRMLFYLPLALGCFWFGIKGALSISAGVSLFYLPYVFRQWQGLSIEDFDRILEGLLYVGIAFVLGFLVDRERKKHAALLQAESLAAMGRALSEVAHDMRTPLVAIGGFANQVAQGLTYDDPNRKKLDVVIQETARLESMVNKMLEFGRPLVLRNNKINLNALIQESLQVALPMAEKTGVELKANLDTSLPSLFLDAPRVKQVLLNLMTNAMQASPAGEQVWVKTRLEKEGVFLDVTDCGCGIAEDHRDILFHPFISTKKGGTGLGLAIVKKIVQAHGGVVSFHSNGKRGATFTVQFPLSKAVPLESID